jgi:hypothetical protein
MTLDIKHWILSHLIWVIGVSIAVVAFYSWKAEYSARLQAEAQIKVSEAQVRTLQQSIADRDKQTQQQVAPIVRIIHDVQTPAQAVAALPKVLDLPTPVIPQANNAVLIPAPDIVPIFTAVADDKVCRALLGTSQQDLTDTRGIVKQKDDEITALKKPQGFWKRVGGTMKAVGVGIGIGIVLGTHKF